MIFVTVNDENGDFVDVTRVSHVMKAMEDDKRGFESYVVMHNGLFLGSHLTAIEIKARMDNKIGRAVN